MTTPIASSKFSGTLLVILIGSLSLNAVAAFLYFSYRPTLSDGSIESRQDRRYSGPPAAPARTAAGSSRPKKLEGLRMDSEPGAFSVSDYVKALRDEPLAKRIAVRKQRGRMLTRYRDFVREANLPNAVADRLFDILADERVTIQQVTLEAQESGTSAAETLDKIQSTHQQFAGSISSLLDPKQVSELEDYQSKLSAKMQVGDIASQLLYSSDPLTVEQKKAVADILNGSRDSLDPKAQALYTARTSIGELYTFPLTDVVLQKLGTVLNPSQQRTVYEIALAQMDEEDLYVYLKSQSKSSRAPHN